MPTPLPPDEVVLEQTLVTSIRDVFNSVPIIAQHVKVETRERFPDTDEEDEEISTVADLIVPTKSITSIIEIGIPTVDEFEYIGDISTQLNFTYPIRYSLEVVDNWNDSALVYRNSRALFMAVYMKARKAFKFNRDFGFDNCVHEYLQQENVDLVEDEETGGRLHVADWSLTVKCTGILA